MKILPVLILFFLCDTAFSRVGETIEECKSRYGLPVGKLKEQLHFKKNGLDVFVSFSSGKASSIRFSGKITYAMAEELLKANGDGKNWLVELNDRAIKIWKTDDKELEANYVYATREDVAHFIILSRPLTNAAREAQKEAERKKVEGF